MYIEIWALHTYDDHWSVPSPKRWGKWWGNLFFVVYMNLIHCTHIHALITVATDQMLCQRKLSVKFISLNYSDICIRYQMKWNASKSDLTLCLHSMLLLLLLFFSRESDWWSNFIVCVSVWWVCIRRSIRSIIKRKRSRYKNECIHFIYGICNFRTWFVIYRLSHTFQKRKKEYESNKFFIAKLQAAAATAAIQYGK